MRVLVIRAAFPDRPFTRPTSDFIGGPDALIDRFVAYFREVSSGRLTLEPTVAETVVTLPAERATYVQRPAALASDALRAFGATLTDDAQREALTNAQAVIVVFAGPGRESHIGGGDPGDPWSNYTNLVPPVFGFEDAIVLAAEEVPPFSSFGVLCHEFGHLLGLPELYAPGGRPQEGIGKWGLMGQGTWVGKGSHPSGLDAWSKLKLGWVDVETIAETTRGVELPSVLEEPRIVKIPAVSGRPEEYYLLENRQRVGVDAELPGAGILVWHVDERVRGFRSAMNDVEHKLLHLVEMDGRNDLDLGHAAGGNRGDATDPWYAAPRWRRSVGAGLALAGAVLLAAAVLRAARPRFAVPVALRVMLAAAALGGAAVLWRPSPAAGPGTPGMAPYGGAPGRVILRNFSPSGPRMRVDVVVAPESDGR